MKAERTENGVKFIPETEYEKDILREIQNNKVDSAQVRNENKVGELYLKFAPRLWDIGF